MTRPRAKGHIKEQNQPIDTVIGSNLRLLRRAAGIGMPTMAKHVGVSYQQLQKYECGTNRLSCSTLYVIADYLKISPLAFFSGLDLYDKASLISSKELPEFGWHGAEVLRLFQNLDRSTRATFLSVLRAMQ